MSLDLPDIEPYRSKHRKADPTDGVVTRWLRAAGHPVPGKWTKRSRAKAYELLGIPPRVGATAAPASPSPER